MPYTGVDDPVTYLQERKNSGATIIALEITDESQSLFTYQPPPAISAGKGELILLAGSEVGGISDSLLGCCEAAVHLPMHGQNTSMNVAVALGAAVYLLLMKLN